MKCQAFQISKSKNRTASQTPNLFSHKYLPQVEGRTNMPKTSSENQSEAEEPVWTYRGYRLRTSEFVTAMTHLFRAEIHRAGVWRQRLDTTTNWAVVSTGATLSIAFSQPDIHHGIIILNTLL